LIPLSFWGLGLFFHAWAAFSSYIKPKALQREMLRDDDPAVRLALEGERKASRRRRGQSIARSAQILEDTVEKGIAAVLKEVTDELQRRAAPPTRTRVPDEGQRAPVDDDATHEASEWAAPKREHR